MCGTPVLEIVLTIIFILIVYAGLAVLNGFIARKRKHSFIIWMLISLCIMPPIALIAILALCREDNTHKIP